jgi:hypothetical protein
MSRASASAAAIDAPPMPPVEPALSDCCGSGCSPCIVDLYQDALDRYEVALAAWQARQAGAAAPPLPRGPDPSPAPAPGLLPGPDG